MTLAAEAPARGMPWWLKRHETLLAIILVIALVGLGAFNDRFLTVDNLLNQGRLMTEIGLIALPMTFIIITGGIDLSVGAVVGLCAIMLGYSWKNFGFPLPVAIVFALAPEPVEIVIVPVAGSTALTKPPMPRFCQSSRSFAFFASTSVDFMAMIPTAADFPSGPGLLRTRMRSPGCKSSR